MRKENIEAMDIVSSVKNYSSYIDKNFYGDHINFLGCSESYVEEKINHLIYMLQHLKKYLRAVEKIQEQEEKTMRVKPSKHI